MSVDHYENFPVASWLCPPHLRPAVAAIYWFARTADDVADEGDALPMLRLQALAQYQADLQACAAGLAHSGRWPQVFKPLQAAMATYALPVELLAALLSAFAQDVRFSAERRHYRNRAELLDYCQRSANPVGRLMLHLYQVSDAQSLAQSDCICTALQLINFWQDLSVDLPRGRYYLPLDGFARHGLRMQQLLHSPPLPTCERMLQDHANWARELMHQGAPLALQLPGRVGWELRAVVQGGLRTLHKVQALGARSLYQRARLRAWDAPLIGWRMWRMPQ